jgi:hypothetical protein
MGMKQILIMIFPIPLGFAFVGWQVFGEGKPATFFTVPIIYTAFAVFKLLKNYR